MRILCIGNRYPPWSNGGYEVAWAGAVKALRGAGHSVRVLTTAPDPSDREADATDPDVHRDLRWYWRDHQFPRLGFVQRLSLERHNAAALSRHLAGFAPDAVAWWAMGGMSLSLLEQVRRAEIPAVGAVCDDWMVYGPQVDQWTRSWRRGGARLAGALTGIPARVDLDTAASWAFISDHTRSAARAAGWLLPGAVVLHAGIDAELFRFSEPGPWRWRLLYCGRIDPRKGVDTAVEALAQLPAEATLTIDGGGEDRYRRELESLAARLGVSGRIRFEASPHSDIQAVYAAADAVVFPVTWEEPWGLVPLEAMATGRPVLASRAGGGAAEYLREGENCLQFAPGESSGLAAAVERLANEAELRAQLVAVGVETASQHTDRRYHEALERELISAVATVRGVR